MRSINLLFVFGMRRKCLRNGRSRSLYLCIKKGDNTGCSNYRGISRSPTVYKIISNILPSKLTSYAEEIIGDHQCGFRRNRSVTDHILCIHQILDKKWENSEAVGTAVAQYLRYCATNQKVASSIPAGVSGFFIDIILPITLRPWGRFSL